MTLFVCVGTCNLITKYQNGRIELTGHNSNPAYNLINTLEDIYHCVRTFDQSVKLVFLHLPYYSISNYYKHKGEINHGQYKEDDYILQTQIDIVNHYINDTNRVLHPYTPPFLWRFSILQTKFQIFIQYDSVANFMLIGKAQITLFVWIGTCNLTTKYQNGRIELTVVIQIHLIISSTHLRTFIILSEHLISQSNYYKLREI